MSQLNRRDRVLSLKHSTIEACFSVPMLNLTMPNLPFLLAFATASLQCPSWAIGLIAALPHLCNAVQPPISRALERKHSLQTIMRTGFAVSAVPWFFVGASAGLPGLAADLAFAVLLTVATLANSVTSVAWSAAISELVPPRMSGAYFGRRNLIFGTWTLAAVLAAGRIADLTENSVLAFGLIFAAAGAARLAGLFFLRKMRFPESVTHPRGATFKFSDLLLPVRDANYRVYALFVGLWGMFLNMSLPFQTVFLLRHLSMEIGQTIALSTIATLGGLLTLRSWGALSDRFGSKPVQHVCAYSWILVGLCGWLLAGPGRQHHLLLVFLIVGGATAGFQLAQFNLMLRLTPQGMGSLYIAAFLAVTSGLTALGPVLGGALLAAAPPRLGTIDGMTVTNYHALFAVSFLGCLLSLPLLTAAREPAAAGSQAVWRTMWRMRSFNPLLALTNAAGFLLTPRGIVSLANVSARSFRREVRRVIEVAEDLAAGGRKALGADRRRR